MPAHGEKAKLDGWGDETNSYYGLVSYHSFF